MRSHPDFDTIADAIRFLEANQRRQPSLDQVAEHVGLSRYHLQRLFTGWAGVSPKRFLQFLTLDHAKRLLKEAEPVLQTSFAVGLSGPGRLHDLFVNTEAVTPGEFRNRGSSLEIRHGFHPTPFGMALLAATERGICSLSFLSSEDLSGKEALRELEEQWPRAVLLESAAVTRHLVERVFPPKPPLPLFSPSPSSLRGRISRFRFGEPCSRHPPDPSPLTDGWHGPWINMAPPGQWARPWPETPWRFSSLATGSFGSRATSANTVGDLRGRRRSWDGKPVGAPPDATPCADLEVSYVSKGQRA